MRLEKYEVDAIKESFITHFGSGHVYLFGSRVDDKKRGGDIDLLIETQETTSKALQRKIPFLVALKQVIGDQKIDVVIQGSDSGRKAIYDIAHREGVELV